MSRKFLYVLVGIVIIAIGIGIWLLVSKKSSVSAPAVAGDSVIDESASPTDVPTDVPSPEPTFTAASPTPIKRTVISTPTPTIPPANSPDRSHSSFTVDNSHPTVGSQASLLIKLANSAGVALPGLTVNLSTSDTGATFSNNGAVTDNAGQVTIQISSVNVSNDSIDVAVSGNGVSVTLSGLGSVNFQAVPPTDTPVPTDVPTPTP